MLLALVTSVFSKGKCKAVAEREIRIVTPEKTVRMLKLKLQGYSKLQNCKRTKCSTNNGFPHFRTYRKGLARTA
jgi:hypothetical protein